MFLVGTSLVVAQAEQWESDGGLVPFAYDPFSNGLGATVWIYNAQDHPVAINGITVDLVKESVQVGTITLSADSNAYLGSYDSMSVNCGPIENPRDIDTIYTRSNHTDMRYWDMDGNNLSHDLNNLDFTHYVSRNWETIDGDICFHDTYEIKSY